MIRLVLDMPISANKRLNKNRSLTDEARDYKQATAWDALSQMLESGDKMYTVPVQVKINVYKWGGDIDNIAKLLLDALKGVAYIDDRLINRLIIERCKGGERRVEVEIAPY